jgi:hypothetical protein
MDGGRKQGWRHVEFKRKKRGKKNKSFHLGLESSCVCMHSFPLFLFGCLCMVRRFWPKKRALHRLACGNFHVHVVFYYLSISVI